MRIVGPAHLAAATMLVLLGACEDDATVGPAPVPDASIDVVPPTDATDSNAPIDAGTPVDWTKIRWQLLPALPLDGVRAGSECDVAVDADDRVLVTYGEAADGYAAPRSLGVFRQDGAAWSLLGGTSLVADSGSYATWPRLAVANDGTIYIGFNHDGPRVQRFAAGAWTALPSPTIGTLWSIAVDSANLPVVTGTPPNEARQLSRFDGAAWGAPTSPLATPDASGSFLLNGVLAIAPRADGSIVALARTTTTKLAAYTLTGGTSGVAPAWSPLGPDLAEGGEFPELSSALQSGSTTAVHLSASWSSGDNVFAARFDAPTQSFVPLGGALGAPNSRYAVTAIDAFDRPFVAWRAPNEPINVSIFAAGAWQSLPSPASSPGTLPAIALDRRGLPVVCWQAPREAGTASEVFVARGVVE